MFIYWNCILRMTWHILRQAIYKMHQSHWTHAFDSLDTDRDGAISEVEPKRCLIILFFRRIWFWWFKNQTVDPTIYLDKLVWNASQHCFFWLGKMQFEWNCDVLRNSYGGIGEAFGQVEFRAALRTGTVLNDPHRMWSICGLFQLVYRILSNI